MDIGRSVKNIWWYTSQYLLYSTIGTPAATGVWTQRLWQTWWRDEVVKWKHFPCYLTFVWGSTGHARVSFHSVSLPATQFKIVVVDESPGMYGPFYKHEFNHNPARRSNHMPSKVWDGITYPLPNFDGRWSLKCEWKSIFIPNFIMDVITYPCWDSN